jgi:hypothetical protein
MMRIAQNGICKHETQKMANWRMDDTNAIACDTDMMMTNAPHAMATLDNLPTMCDDEEDKGTRTSGFARG